MKKVNWGTGIFAFLVLFVVALVSFVIFASRQEVNLVHKDYYEKGVDYSEQIKMNERSKSFSEAFNTQLSDDFFTVEIEKELAAQIDSGNIYLYRPSTYTKDINIYFEKGTQRINIPKSELISGRYIVKFYWYTDGIKYETDKTITIP